MQHTKQFPLLLSKVLYSGTHCGDSLTVEEVKELRPEVRALVGLSYDNPEIAGYVREFAAQMVELVECSLGVGKPLAF
jgi:hypothetical protein